MIYVCIPTRDSINANTVGDLVALLKTDSSYSFATVIGVYIQSMREGIAHAVKDSGATHLMFIDSDMMFPKDTIKMLQSRDKDIIGANYVRRIEQDKWSASINGNSVISTGQKGVQEVDSIGMGMCLIKTDVFKKIPQPWFDMAWIDGNYQGEDISFCNHAKENGYKIYVDHDLSQQVHHVGDIFLGADNYKVPEYIIPDIEGWMEPIEMQFLYSKAKEMDSIIELGSWKGRSTHALASGCKGTVTAIDHWKGNKENYLSDVAKKEDVFAQFKENTKEFNNILTMKMSGMEAVKEFKDGSVDMVFIDAGHNYEQIKPDIIAWLPKARKLICGHDYSSSFPGVLRAVNEVFGEPDGVAGSIWWKEIK
jgi:hypothetical protein